MMMSVMLVFDGFDFVQSQTLDKTLEKLQKKANIQEHGEGGTRIQANQVNAGDGPRS